MIFTVSDLTSWYWEVDRLVIKCWHSVDQVSIDYLLTCLIKPTVNLVQKTNLGNSPLSGCDWWKLAAHVLLQRLEAWLMTTQPPNRASGQRLHRLQQKRSIDVNWQTVFYLSIQICVGDFVMFRPDENSHLALYIACVRYMWEEPNGEKMFHCRWFRYKKLYRLNAKMAAS